MTNEERENLEREFGRHVLDSCNGAIGCRTCHEFETAIDDQKAQACADAFKPFVYMSNCGHPSHPIPCPYVHEQPKVCPRNKGCTLSPGHLGICRRVPPTVWCETCEQAVPVSEAAKGEHLHDKIRVGKWIPGDYAGVIPYLPEDRDRDDFCENHEEHCPHPTVQRDGQVTEDCCMCRGMPCDRVRRDR
jgi:hypothetical protein